MVSVKRGEKSGQFGGVDKFSRYVGLSPPDMTYVVKGGASFAPSCAAVPLDPRTCPNKLQNKKVVCVFGMGFGQLATGLRNCV